MSENQTKQSRNAAVRAHRKVSRREPSAQRGGNEAAMAVFLRAQDARAEEPSEYLPINQCRDLRDRGLGEFINRGTAFRRFDRATAADAAGDYEARGGRGQSLRVAEPPPQERPDVVRVGVMTRYVADRNAGKNTATVEAVEGWRNQNHAEQKPQPVFPYTFRLDRAGRKGKPCRVGARGRNTGSLLLEFEDGFKIVVSANAIKLRTEFKTAAALKSAAAGKGTVED